MMNQGSASNNAKESGGNVRLGVPVVTELRAFTYSTVEIL